MTSSFTDFQDAGRSTSIFVNSINVKSTTSLGDSRKCGRSGLAAFGARRSWDGETIDVRKRFGDLTCQKSGSGTDGLLAIEEGVKQLRSSGVPNRLLVLCTNNAQIFSIRTSLSYLMFIACFCLLLVPHDLWVIDQSTSEPKCRALALFFTFPSFFNNGVVLRGSDVLSQIPFGELCLILFLPSESFLVRRK